MKDATTALIAALRDAAGPHAGFALEEVRSRAWASVTFQGARHELAFRLDGDEAAAERFLGTLEGAEIGIEGHILADLALVSQERRKGGARIRLEALTVCDG